jgi:hypothetical protein
MDSLSYHYISGTNQLDYVDDQVTESAFDYDIDDQSGANYTYDEIGNLIFDASEYIAEIKWTVYGKIKQIIRDSTVSHGKPDLLFEYSPDGHRVAKHVIDTSGKTTSTWYIRDASGNVMATYTRDYVQALDIDSLTYMEIYNQLALDKTIQSRLTLLDSDLDWIQYMGEQQLDDIVTEIQTADVKIEVL